MRERTRATIAELRTAIGCLPRVTRRAMLDGIESNRIVVGAYTHEDGICPMLAAHRAGGRTSFVTFARAWDRFAFGRTGSRRARRATERELLVLRSHLEASLLDEDAPASSLGAVIAEHEALRERRQAAQSAARSSSVSRRAAHLRRTAHPPALERRRRLVGHN